MSAQLRETRNASHGGDDASGDFGQADDGAGASDDHVAVEDGLCAASHADAVDGCDDGLGASASAHASEAAALEALKRLVDLSVGLHGLSRRMTHSVGGLVLVEPVLEVLTGAEGSALSSKDDDPQRRLGLEPVKDAADVLLHGIGHGIELLGSVERHLEHVLGRRGEDQMRAHLGHGQSRARHGDADVAVAFQRRDCSVRAVDRIVKEVDAR